MALVYLHTNKITNQKYVGISNYSDPNKRWRDGKGYETQYFGKAGVAVYGWDGFKHEVLAENLDSKVAATLESLLISKLETSNLKYGYNTSEGKIFPDYIAEAKNILNDIIVKNPYILDRSTSLEGAQPIKFSSVSLDPPVIKTIKVGLSISRYSLGSIVDYFDEHIDEACLIIEKTNTSFLVIIGESLIFIDKGEVYTYPFETTYIRGNTDKWDIKENCWKYKSIEVIDDNKIKPTLIISGTIANMKEFPIYLLRAVERRNQRIIREEKERQKQEQEKLAREEAIRLEAELQERIKREEEERQARKQARIARWKAWVKKHLHINL